MANLSGKKVKDTYQGLIKTVDNEAADASNRELSDGAGNDLNISVNTGGDLTAVRLIKSSGTSSQFLMADGSVLTLTTESAGISSSDTDNNIPTNAAVKDYVDDEINDLLGGAPAALDTLNELAAAINDDSTFNTTITNALAKRLAVNSSQSFTEGEITQALSNLGITATKVELNILDGVTATATELNKLDGLTSSTAELNILDGVTATSAELNILDGVTATATELNKLDGVTASTAELNHTDGVTSNIQTQINNITDNNTTYGVSAVDSNDDAIIRLTGSDSSTDDVKLVAGSNITITPSGDDITIASTASGGGGGGVSWQSAFKTSNFTATANEGYFVDVSSGSVTVTMPTSPSVGDNVGIVDVKGSAQTNAISITSSNNIQGSSDDKDLNYERGAINLVYSGSTDGWVISSAANEGSNSLAVQDFTVEYLVAAGGGGSGGITTGGGANYSRGGGGAGGLRTSHASDTSGGGGSTESTLSLSPNTNYTVTVGSGGAYGVKGEDSVFDAITSEGGGHLGNDGGSGGGADWADSTAGSGTTNQGFAGGSNTSFILNGGGGGAGEAGNTDGAGSGGDGVISTIITSSQATTNSVGEVSGSDVYFAGGGSSGGAAAGLGGGGQSGANNGGDNVGGDGDANSGGGGGSATVDGPGTANGGAGGSGVVIIRYPSSLSVSETTSGGDVLTFTTITDGDEKITIFKSGDGTIKFS